MNVPEKSYFICSSPRTGSTFLCSLIKSSGLAGNPESYFRKQDLQKWADQWNVLDKDTNSFDVLEYIKAAIRAGSTDNGVFSARIMWGTMEELVCDLAPFFPDQNGCDKDILERAFGDVSFVYLKRLDFVAQAVSRSRAEQTGLWHLSGEEKPGTLSKEPQYDFKQIHAFVKEAEEHNKAWETWFEENGVSPYLVVYEYVVDNPAEELRKMHDFLGIELPENIKFEARNRRLSDEVNETWIRRYRDDL